MNAEYLEKYLKDERLKKENNCVEKENTATYVLEALNWELQEALNVYGLYEDPTYPWLAPKEHLFELPCKNDQELDDLIGEIFPEAEPLEQSETELFGNTCSYNIYYICGDSEFLVHKSFLVKERMTDYLY